MGHKHDHDLPLFVCDTGLNINYTPDIFLYQNVHDLTQLICCLVVLENQVESDVKFIPCFLNLVYSS